MRELESGSVDIIWRSYENLDSYCVQPIRLPIFKNLSDYQVLP